MESVRRLLLVADYDEELKALGQLVQPQVSSGKPGDLTLLGCESPVLQFDSDDESCFKSQSLLEDLLLYLVVRKFGATADSAGGKVILGTDQQIFVNWNQRDAQQLAELRSFVDTLHKLLLDSEWEATTISCLNRVVKRLQDPRARQRFLTFTFQVLSQGLQRNDSLAGNSPQFDAKFFDEAVRLLLLGVTDLWSAIRKDCGKAAATIAFQFPSQTHIEQFMDSLLGIAIGSRSVSADKSQVTAWTEREGALLALSVILRSIKVDFTPESTVVKVSQVKDAIMLSARQSSAVKYQFGSNERHKLTQLPRCLVQTLKPAIYQCLRHDQLSVRQLAAQCLVKYATLCEEPTRLLIFQEVISKLNRMNRNDKAGENGNPNDSELLDAFEAEGLLDVLARMVPCLPSGFLLKHWKFVFPTLEKYVMHIASSVRQKSSSVVLALATSIREGKSVSGLESNSTSETSLQLIVQMLLCLSNKRSDESCFCWQQREGRLLSIEVLVNVLGESLVGCQSNKLLRWGPGPPKLQQGQLNSPRGLQTFHWAHDRAQWSTWPLDDGKMEKDQVLEVKQGAASEELSLVQEISAWVDKNRGQRGQSDIPASSQDFWKQVLSGCISQTKEAFESSQFELRRISRQLLPGLMRLVVWTEQLGFLSSTEFESEFGDTSWCCTCAKFTLLHLRYLQESLYALGGCTSSSVSQKLERDWKIMWNGVAAIEKNTQNLSADTETSVTQVEMRVLVFLCFGGTDNPPRQITQFLDSALLQSIHVHIPEGLQLESRLGTTVSTDSSLDRQFSIFLVPMLPAYVSTLQYLVERDDSSTSDAVQVQEAGLSWHFRWICLERIVVAWLSCDDMMRWITMNKSEAESKLLESLRILLRLVNSRQILAEVHKEFDRIIRCLNGIFPAPQIKLKDATYTNLLDIYLQMWLSCTNSDHDCYKKLLVAIVRLYSQRQQFLDVADANLKQVPAVATWNDWDEEEEAVQQASPVDEVREPQGLPNQDALFQEILRTLDTSQLSLFNEAVRAHGTGDVSARMQQQIEACLKL